MLSRAVHHVARLMVKPTPSTLSESFAILRYVRTLGQVTKFARYDGSTRSPTKHTPVEHGSETIYDVEFSSISQKLEDLHRSGSGKSLKFKVDANANQPDPKDLDPYNVRGLLDRKPSLPPRRFACKMTLYREAGAGRVHKKDRPGQENTTDSNHNHSIGQDRKASEYTGSFQVDRSSVFAQIYEQIDTPRHMIAGLLPKVDETHQDIEYIDAQGNRPKPRDRRAWKYAKQQRARTLPREVHDPDFSLMRVYKDHVRGETPKSAD